jgi:hypothetical protein
MIRFRSCSHYRSSLAACLVRMRAIALKGRGRPIGPRIICSSIRKGAVLLVQYWKGNALDLLLILEDNYKLTTNNFTTETQSAQRTHRDFSRAICCMLQIAILAGLSTAAPGSRSIVVAAVAPGCAHARRLLLALGPRVPPAHSSQARVHPFGRSTGTQKMITRYSSNTESNLDLHLQ